MKLTLIYGAVSGYELGLDTLAGVITETLKELGEETDSINLDACNLPYFTGKTQKSADDILQKIAGSDGVVFAATATSHAPCALMQTLLEYLGGAAYSSILSGKNCLIVTSGKDGGERDALEYLSGVIIRAGGYDAVRICAGAGEASNMQDNPELKEIIERQTEDFYRILRQNRKFIVPKRDVSNAVGDETDESGAELSDEDYFRLFGKQRKYTVNIEELYAKHSYTPDEVSDDINDIANIYAQKFLKSKSGITQASLEPVGHSFKKNEPVKPRAKNCKQLTQSLPHHFNPQAATGIRAVFQLNITGPGGFDGYIAVDNSDCSFDEGQAESSDIVIIADDKVWTEIINNKYTAQKAFMVGKLKVRGNFMLLTKFDTFFNKVM